MTSKERMLIAQMRKYGKGYTEISKELGISANTVKSYCYRNGLQRGNIAKIRNGEVCKQCGEKLEHTSGRKKKQFCSDTCRLQWWHAHRDMSSRAKEIQCSACGKMFVTDRAQKYCSHLCYINARFGGVDGNEAHCKAV